MKEAMLSITRRNFGALALLAGARPASLTAADGLNETLGAGMKRRAIPLAAAMVATATKTTYAGAFGKRDSTSGVDVTIDSIFRIASMTKAVTATAVMQLVEQGKLGLEEPISKHLRQLGNPQVLEGFDKDSNKQMLRPASKPILLRHILTHTSGLVYENWDANLVKYLELTGPVDADTGNRVTGSVSLHDSDAVPGTSRGVIVSRPPALSNTDW